MEEPKVPFCVGVSFIASNLPRKPVNRLACRVTVHFKCLKANQLYREVAKVTARKPGIFSSSVRPN